MIAGALPLTEELASMAKRLGVDHDLTRFSLREQALNDMKAAFGKTDGSFEAAKARFESLKPESVE